MAYKTDAKSAKRMLRGNKNAVLVDVRTKEEYEEDHVKGSVLLPYDRIDSMAKYILPHKDAVIIVGCSSGFRSGIAARRLEDMGYTKVYNAGKILDLK